MGISVATYERVALEDGDTVWELACGRLREKPGMTQEHNDAASMLSFLLQSQLPLDAYRVRRNAGRLRRGTGTAFVPDVAVIPAALSRVQRGTRQLETFEGPLPFVAEVWSPSTGGYDVDTNFPEYRARGDEVIWRVHPYEKSVRAWERQADGSYSERQLTASPATIPSLPGVAIDLQRLFE